MQDKYTRVRWLLGEEEFNKISKTKILLCGLGGVGGVCADTLFRSGLSDITVIDSDSFELTNQNRQLHSENLAQKKAEVFARIYGFKAIVARIDEKFLASFNTLEFDVIIDAIDDIKAKVALANSADLKKQIYISSMGGARKIDSTRIKVAPVFKTYGDALAKKFRYELKKSGFKGSFDVVFSDEEPRCKNLGSFMGVTASFGLNLASLLIRKLLEKA